MSQPAYQSYELRNFSRPKGMQLSIRHKVGLNGSKETSRSAMSTWALEEQDQQVKARQPKATCTIGRPVKGVCLTLAKTTVNDSYLEMPMGTGGYE